MAQMTATEVSCNFSAALNRVDSGEQIEIVRNGKVVAQLGPPSRPRGVNGEQWDALIARLPPADEGFAGDVQEARRRVGSPAPKWPS
jgi:antitoxin (DNA-binding transcriptional repressor) of toxin-antitoxin stability system